MRTNFLSAICCNRLPIRAALYGHFYKKRNEMEFNYILFSFIFVNEFSKIFFRIVNFSLHGNIQIKIYFRPVLKYHFRLFCYIVMTLERQRRHIGRTSQPFNRSIVNYSRLAREKITMKFNKEKKKNRKEKTNAKLFGRKKFKVKREYRNRGGGAVAGSRRKIYVNSCRVHA